MAIESLTTKAQPRPIQMNPKTDNALENPKRSRRWLERFVSHRRSIAPGLNDSRSKHESAIDRDRNTGDGLVVVLTPCFKSGGFDIYANGNISRFLDAALPCFGHPDPILVSLGPVGVGKHRGYLHKIVSRVKWNGDLHNGSMANDKSSPTCAEPGSERKGGDQ